MPEQYSRLDRFSVEFLKSSGDLKDRSIHPWHLAADVSGVFAPSGVTGTYTIGGGEGGDLASITFVDGICKAVTLVDYPMM